MISDMQATLNTDCYLGRQTFFPGHEQTRMEQRAAAYAASPPSLIRYQGKSSLGSFGFDSNLFSMCFISFLNFLSCTAAISTII